jgi:hypothetical protein
VEFRRQQRLRVGGGFRCRRQCRHGGGCLA